MSTKTYSYGSQCIEDDDIEAVVATLKSDWLTQGPTVPAFESALAEKCGAAFVSALSSGTAGLHLVALALGWKSGDLVLTTPLTFTASANAILYAGGSPDFVDIDPVRYTMDPNLLEDKLESLASKGRWVKAVIATDFAGQPCDWPAFRALADKYGFDLVNDACHALGATLDKDATYASRYADAAVLSFHPVKHITTGEGGAVLTNDSDLDTKIKLLRTHGITRDPAYLTRNGGPWYYEMHALGFNYRLNDIQAALGLSQLPKLDRFVAARRRIARFYDTIFKENNRFVIPAVAPKVEHAYHLYPLQVRFEELEVTRQELFTRLKKLGINLQVHYIPVHLQPYYREKFGSTEGDFPLAEAFYRQEISIPIHPGLDDEDLDYIGKCILGAVI